MEPLKRGVLTADMDCLKGWRPSQREEITRRNIEARFNDIERGQCFGAPDLIDVSMCVGGDGPWLTRILLSPVHTVSSLTMELLR